MRYLFYITFIIVAFSGCSKKTDDLFDEPADIRLEKALAAYKGELMKAPGWKLFVYPKGLESQDIEVGGLTYYITFPDSNRTIMVSDFTFDMAGTPKESGYRIRAVQRPSLVFDTYSYIHVAADPDENVSFSPTQSGGYGWGTDFDFAFTKLEPGDSMTLKGNFNGSDAYLLAATKEEIDAAFSGQLAHIVGSTILYARDNQFLYFNSIDNNKVGVSFNLFLYRVNFNYIDGGNLVTTSAPFSHTIDGIHFKAPVTIGGYTFQDLFWDEAQKAYYFVLPGGERVNFTSSPEPLFPLSVALGRLVTTISVPTTPLPGQSATFADVYQEVKDSLKSTGYNLDLDVMDYIFDDQSKMMAMNVYVTRDGITYLVQYRFQYTINASGIADFTLTEANGNGEAVFNEMLPLLRYIELDIFKMDYFDTGSAFLGQFTSQDHPDFFFTGTLQ